MLFERSLINTCKVVQMESCCPIFEGDSSCSLIDEKMGLPHSLTRYCRLTFSLLALFLLCDLIEMLFDHLQSCQKLFCARFEHGFELFFRHVRCKGMKDAIQCCISCKSIIG